MPKRLLALCYNTGLPIAAGCQPNVRGGQLCRGRVFGCPARALATCLTSAVAYTLDARLGS